MKLEFGYLKPKQAWKLFKDECGVLGIELSDAEKMKIKIRSLGQLAPGDFAAVIRQSRLRPLKSAEIFLDRLLEEVSVKEGSTDIKMGFL